MLWDRVRRFHLKCGAFLIVRIFLVYTLAFVFLLSFALCASAIRRALPYASRLAVAVPNDRSSHDVPTPQCGGLFLFGAVVLSAFSACVLHPDWLKPMVGTLLPALALAVIGWIDDRRGLAVIARLLAFTCIAIVTTLMVSFSFHFLVVAFVLLVMINITNFMDGIDGMVVVEFVPMLAMFAVLAALGFFGEVLGALAIALAGGLLGFFLFNRPKAKIFLGDSGSLVVGFLGGIFLLECAEYNGWMVAMILPSYFLADAGLTLLRRALRGERIWKAHREHFYQQAFDSGQSNWSIILRVALCNLWLCAITYGAMGESVLTLLIACIAGVGLVFLLLVTLARPTRPVAVSRDNG